MLRAHVTLVRVVAAPFPNSQPYVARRVTEPDPGAAPAGGFSNIALILHYAQSSTVGVSLAPALTYDAPENSGGQRVAT